MAKFCTNCGGELKDGFAFCEKCGSPVDGGKQTKNVEPASVNNTYNTYNVAPAKKSNGLALGGFITTLVSTLLCCGSFNLIGLILCIVGLVKAKDYDGNGKGLAIAGIVINVLFIVLGVILTILGVFAGALENLDY